MAKIIFVIYVYLLFKEGLGEEKDWPLLETSINERWLHGWEKFLNGKFTFFNTSKISTFFILMSSWALILSISSKGSVY